ncbi:MAG TPA: response regulator [Elusimicrobia bacterium]|nr:response regulator [Elusimicrobiota bacterium]
MFLPPRYLAAATLQNIVQYCTMADEQNFADPADKLVLLVEDDDAFMDFIEFMVKRQGFNVEKAADGEVGLWKARNLSPDLILLDLMLPKFGGFDVLKELQAHETINIPIVILTGASSEFAKEEQLLAEPNVLAFLRKPVNPSELTALLHKLLGTKPA